MILIHTLGWNASEHIPTSALEVLNNRRHHIGDLRQHVLFEQFAAPDGFVPAAEPGVPNGRTVSRHAGRR